MPSPSSASPTTAVVPSSQLIIDALVAGMKWGGALGTGVTLTYSFPWAVADSATFLGPDGGSDYSDAQEHLATSHRALNSTELVAAVMALQAWASVANLTFTQSADTGSTVGDIRFAWSSALPSDAGAWASYPDDYYPSGGDIWLNDNINSVRDGSWDVGGFNYKLLMHEIGHALGLKHPFEDTPVLPGPEDSHQYTVMSYTNAAHSLYGYITSSGNSRYYNYKYIYPDTPMVNDIAAIQYLYGANMSYMTGNDTYSFDQHTPFLRTIWDAGGTDTISIAGFFKGCTVDLRPGHYSSLAMDSTPTVDFPGATLPTYDGTDNLGIAYGCVIENAIGGDGNDLLIGNDANNILAGGYGDDTLQGGQGMDTAIFEGEPGEATITYDALTRQATVTTRYWGTDTLTDIEYASFRGKVLDLRTLGEMTDDYQAGTATAGALVVGGAAMGSVETFGDTDWFAITLRANVIYELNLGAANGGGIDPVLIMYDSNGALIGSDDNSGGGVNARIMFSPDKDGRYYAAAGGADNTIGSYRLSVGEFDTGAPTTLAGTLGNDDLRAGSGNDTLVGSAGNDLFDGRGGLDVVTYEVARSAFTAQANAGGAITVTKSGGGQDVLTNVERLLFTDGAMAFDTGASGVAGQAYRMYQAAFDRAPDAVGLGFWIAMMDKGVTQQQVSAAFVDSPEFKALYGAHPTNEELVTRLYNNVLHRAPEPAGKAFWLDVLDRKLAPVPDVLAAFSESPENREATALVIGAGFGYQPYTG